MVITVRELLFKRFSIRSLDEKIKIVAEGRPRPVLRDYVELNDKTITINQFYDSEIWLTGSDMPNGVYCWTCLLFPCDDLECRSFVADIKDSNLQLKITEHKKTAFHKSGLIQLQLFKIQNSLTVNNHQKKLCDKKRNPAILKRIIDVVCFLAAHQCPVSVKANDDLECNFLEGCVQMLQLIRSYDNVSIADADAVLNVIKTHPIMVTDTVKAIANFMRKAIKKELQLSNHVCLILSEHSEINLKSRLSTVLRYISSEGKICEKFVQFTDVDGSKCMSKIKKYLLNFISEFEISGRFLALSCDGAVLPTPHLSDLKRWIRRRYSLYYFVPCYFHDFNQVLEQHLSVIPECELFFKNLQAMMAFFQNNPKMCEIFNNVTYGEIPHTINFRISNSQFLRVLKLYRKQFASFFWYISKDCEKLDKDDVVKSFGFHHILEEYQTVFLLEAFFQLFDCVSILSETLSSNSPENVFNKNTLDNVWTALSSMKNDGFENLWTLVITEIVTNCKPETLQAVGEKETKHLNDVYTQILDCMIEGVKIRFSSAKNLEFLSVFNCEANCKFIMPDYQMKQLQEMNTPFLDKKLLKEELEILCRNGDLFGGKSVYEVRDVLQEAGLQQTLENVYKLTEFILTLPCKPASPRNTGSSKLELMNSWAAVSDKPEMKLLSFLCIEKDYLEYFKSRIEFYDEVISDLKKLNTEVEEMF